MVAPKPQEPLLLYLTAIPRVVSAVLVVGREEEISPTGLPGGLKGAVALKRSIQRPVHFVSKVLHDAKTRYPTIQKMLYAILIASHKL